MAHTFLDVPLYLVRLEDEALATMRAEDTVLSEAVRVNLIKISEGRNAFYRVEAVEPVEPRTSVTERIGEQDVGTRVDTAEMYVAGGNEDDANSADCNDIHDDADDDDESTPLLEISLDTYPGENNSSLTSPSPSRENSPANNPPSCYGLDVSSGASLSSSSTVLRSLVESYNQAIDKQARKTILEEVSCLNLTAEEKAYFLSGVLDGGPTVAVLADRFRRTKDKEGRRAIRKEVRRLHLGAIFEFALVPGRKK